MRVLPFYRGRGVVAERLCFFWLFILWFNSAFCGAKLLSGGVGLFGVAGFGLAVCGLRDEIWLKLLNG